MSELIEVRTSDGDMPAHLWLPTSGSGPGILLVQEVFGVTPYIERRAQDLADLGYVVLAPEIWWRHGISRVEEGPQALEEAFGLLERSDWALAVSDAAQALGVLAGRPEVTHGAGIVGFCYGGGLGYAAAARTSPDVLVSYYGSALPELLGLAEHPGVDQVTPTEVTATQLHHFGLADSFIARPTVEQIRDILVRQDSVTFETYDADHAFDNDDFHLYDAAASALSWQRTVDFLGRHLPVG